MVRLTRLAGKYGPLVLALRELILCPASPLETTITN
jgi:hypothetical protein